MFDHLGIVVKDLKRSASFYAHILAPLGLKIVEKHDEVRERITVPAPPAVRDRVTVSAPAAPEDDEARVEVLTKQLDVEHIEGLDR